MLTLAHWNPHWECFAKEPACATGATAALEQLLGQSKPDFFSVIEFEVESYVPPPPYTLIGNFQSCGHDWATLIYDNATWALASPPLVGCLVLGWVLIWACVCQGVESLGKVAWFTAIFPYFVLAILLVRGLTLPGASTGLRFYLTPRFDQIWHGDVWVAAASQIFYSTGVGWGTLVAF